MFRSILSFVFLTVTLLSPFAAWSAERASQPVLKSIYRQEHYFDEFFTDETDAVVCVFVSTSCPIVQLSIHTLKELYWELNGIDLDRPSYERFVERMRFVMIYPNTGDDIVSMAAHAQELDYPFLAMLDIDGRFAEQLGARHTPEVFVYDRHQKLRYRGAIDDQYTKGGAKPKARRHYLRDALTQLAAGDPIKRPATVAAGCLIESGAAPTLKRELTYHRDVRPILRDRCQRCHRDGEVAPFALKSYDDALDHAEMIEEVVVDRRMPPWSAHSKHAMSSDVRLSEDEIEIIRGWVRQGSIEGTPDTASRDEDASTNTGNDAEWRIGKPDVIFQMEKPFEVPATGIVDYQYYRFKTNFKTDRWIRGVECQPGNPRVVHHILVHQTPSGLGKFGGFDMLKLYGIGGARSDALVGDYLPGDELGTRKYSADRGVRLMAGNDIIFEVHYTPVGKAQADQSRMGLTFSDKPPAREIKSRIFLKPRGRFEIPPRHPHFKMTDTYWFRKDVRILGIRPHMHTRGKSYQISIVDPEKGEQGEPLLNLPIWEYSWQKIYKFETPIVIRAGQELKATACYDNSEFNPINPDPDSSVKWGQSTYDEMLNTFVLYEELE